MNSSIRVNEEDSIRVEARPERLRIQIDNGSVSADIELTREQARALQRDLEAALASRDF